MAGQDPLPSAINGRTMGKLTVLPQVLRPTELTVLFQPVGLLLPVVVMVAMAAQRPKAMDRTGVPLVVVVVVR